MNEQLPVITGLNIYPLALGNRMESPQVQAALALIGAFNHSPMAGLVELRRVDVPSRAWSWQRPGRAAKSLSRLNNLEQQLAALA